MQKNLLAYNYIDIFNKINNIGTWSVKMLSDCYCVDIGKKMPRIESMIKNDFPNELEYHNTSNIMDLENHDWRLFKRVSGAQKFLENYNKTLLDLPNMHLSAKKELPKMLLKRRYLVTSLMNVKTYTTRKFKKDWKKGQLFQVYDQTFFVTVKLKSIKERTIDGETYYQYDYKTI